MKRGILRVGEGGYTLFRCPGCNEAHAVRVREDGQNIDGAWGFNGDYDRPTFSPSILVRTGHFVPGHEAGRCWCTYAKEHPDEEDDGFRCSICHSFVRDGQIQFLGDCTHALAGQTVPLPDMEGPGE